MNRRSFLGLLVGGVAVVAAVRTFPFRVFSFPTEVVPTFSPELAHLSTIYYSKDSLRLLAKQLKLASVKPYNGKNFHMVMHPLQARQYLEMVGA